jgi:hypothetical protein
MQAYRILAKNTKTKQRLEQQFLDGYRVTNETEALRLAQDFAVKQSRRSRDTWEGVIEVYEAK